MKCIETGEEKPMGAVDRESVSLTVVLVSASSISGYYTAATMLYRFVVHRLT